MSKRTYSPEFKLQFVLEALQSDGADAEVARAYDIRERSEGEPRRSSRIESLWGWTKTEIGSRITAAS